MVLDSLNGVLNKLNGRDGRDKGRTSTSCKMEEVLDDLRTEGRRNPDVYPFPVVLMVLQQSDQSNFEWCGPMKLAFSKMHGKRLPEGRRPKSWTVGRL